MAFAWPHFEVGVYDSQQERMIIRQWDPTTIHQRLSWLRRCNAHGNNIYVRPQHPEHRFTLLDDLSDKTAAAINRHGAVAIVETSSGNFQAWIRHDLPLDAPTSTRVAKILATDHGADPSSADFRHFGRLPGFTNRKPKHRMLNGLYPFVRLYASDAMAPSWTDSVIVAARAQLAQERDEAARLRSLRRAAPRHGLDKAIGDFHADPTFAGDLHRADMAYALYAAGRGLAAGEIADTIVRARDLTHKGSAARQLEYAHRTAEKAVKTVVNA
ncbi:MAG: DNA-primase RepB domain-containing protein [Parvibaculum sp.]|jgi:hypothetical protein